LFSGKQKWEAVRRRIVKAEGVVILVILGLDLVQKIDLENTFTGEFGIDRFRWQIDTHAIESKTLLWIISL
jgi:hypothetical protein